MSAPRSRILPVAVALGVAAGLAATTAIPDRFGACKRPWVFFDLGNTVITSGVGVESHYLPGAHEYLRELRRRGYPVGLITNVPEKWGPNRAARIRELKRLVAETWTKDPALEPMDWTDFPEPLIHLPAREAERKPAGTLYRSALAQVAREEGVQGCPAVFEGEDPIEVEAAIQNGMHGYLVPKDSATPFLSFDRLESL